MITYKLLKVKLINYIDKKERDIYNNSMSKKLEDKHNLQKEIAEPRYSFSSISLLVFNIIFAVANIYCYLALINSNLGWLTYVVVGATALLALLSFLFFFKKWAGWLKATFIVLIIATLFSWGYYLFVVFDLLKYFSDEQALQELIESTGIWGYVIYVLFQFLQVTFIPLPAIVTTMVGTFLFGPGIATILSLIGILLGSLVAFIIGDKLGEKVVIWIVGEKNYKKYGTMLFDKGKYMFFLMMLFPVFPDDILCMLAGMTTMSYRFFITTVLLTRPIGIVMTCYLGSGDIIAYTELWGLIVWGVLILLILAAFWIAYKYKDKIEQIVTNIGVKFSNGMSKFSAKCKVCCENTIAVFSPSYKAKLLLKRNKMPYLMITEKSTVQDNTKQTKKKNKKE